MEAAGSRVGRVMRRKGVGMEGRKDGWKLIRLLLSGRSNSSDVACVARVQWKGGKGCKVLLF